MALDDLRRRLKHLGVITGREFKDQPPAPPPAPLDSLIAGELREIGGAACFVVSHRHPPDTLRGPLALSAWLEQDQATLARMGDIDRHQPSDLRRFVFLDTETTGLGGASTLVFMVGLGFFNEAGEFETHQIFLRDPADEPAMLTLIHQMIAPDGGLVTFNGRTFDVPVLSDRYVLARQKTHLGQLPNLDLLHPARRLWRRRLASCALGALEGDILGLRREQTDVPGWMIPALYLQYLRSGDSAEMARVFYHNEQDILSMVTLGAVLCRAFGQPQADGLLAEDRLSLARWYESREMLAESEAAYRLACEEASADQTREDALSGLAALLKRQERRDEAVPLWELLADMRRDIIGHEELAKHYEWHKGDLAEALRWTEAGARLVEQWPNGRSEEHTSELQSPT